MSFDDSTASNESDTLDSDVSLGSLSYDDYENVWEWEETSDADDDSDMNSSQNPSEHETATEPTAVPAARDHSYLPGSSHPLFPERWLDQQRYHSDTREDSASATRVPNKEHQQLPWKELAILELQGVVLFPGSSIPIRLRNPQWIDYLGRQIDASRSSARTAPIQLGILTHIEASPEEETGRRRRRSSASRRVSWMRTALRVRRQPPTDGLEETRPRLLQGPVPDGLDSPQETTRPKPPPSDPVVGRIGTIATITYTHGDSVSDRRRVYDPRQEEEGSALDQSIWERPDGLLVLTALGTGRFRVVSRLDDDENDDYFNSRRRFYHWGDMARVQMYRVEELGDDNIPLPPLYLRHKQRSTKTEEFSYLARHERFIHNLSNVTPWPAYLYQSTWPWRLVAIIRSNLEQLSSFQGLASSLPSLDGDPSTEANKMLEPRVFADWMASNLPLTESEKLNLLSMSTAIERLRFIHTKVQEQVSQEPDVCCKMCGVVISNAKHLFTVGGAEGTTGAYVNPHGVIHQTITLLELQERNVFYSGGPETRDSWFPGYSWTIASCARCGSHLGWKFLHVLPSSGPPSRQRPAKFYGLSAGSVTTKTSEDSSSSHRSVRRTS